MISFDFFESSMSLDHKSSNFEGWTDFHSNQWFLLHLLSGKSLARVSDQYLNLKICFFGLSRFYIVHSAVYHSLYVNHVYVVKAILSVIVSILRRRYIEIGGSLLKFSSSTFSLNYYFEFRFFVFLFVFCFLFFKHT